MINDTFYDIAIIGGGISSCVFSSGQPVIVVRFRTRRRGTFTHDSVQSNRPLKSASRPREKRRRTYFRTKTRETLREQTKLPIRRLLDEESDAETFVRGERVHI